VAHGRDLPRIRAITRIATPATEARLLEVARAGTAAHVERIVRGWRRVDRLAEAREAKHRHASRGLRVYEDEDGMVVVRGRLEPEVGALLRRALEAAAEALYQTTHRAEGATEDPPTPAQRRADALALVAETALQQGLDPEAAGERYQVVVHVDAAVLVDPEAPGQSVVEGGARVPAGTSRRLACDAHRVVMRHDREGRVLDVGRRTRETAESPHDLHVPLFGGDHQGVEGGRVDEGAQRRNASARWRSWSIATRDGPFGSL
jgi:hypothetical protein